MRISSNTVSPQSFLRQAFSLVEVLAAITIIGIITFIAIPNLVRIKEDGERSLAISRAEALNVAMAAFVQAHGRANAATLWGTAGDNDARYELVDDYLAFAPDDLDDYMPGGYSVTMPTSIDPMTKVTLTGPGNSPVSGYGQ